jgi:hypothetical protein
LVYALKLLLLVVGLGISMPQVATAHAGHSHFAGAGNVSQPVFQGTTMKVESAATSYFSSAPSVPADVPCSPGSCCCQGMSACTMSAHCCPSNLHAADVTFPDIATCPRSRFGKLYWPYPKLVFGLDRPPKSLS